MVLRVWLEYPCALMLSCHWNGIWGAVAGCLPYTSPLLPFHPIPSCGLKSHQGPNGTHSPDIEEL